MIDEKEILAARQSIAGLTSSPILELNRGDRILVSWQERVFICEVRQINIQRDRFSGYWSVSVRVDDGKTRGDWNFYFPTDYRVIVVKGES